MSVTDAEMVYADFIRRMAAFFIDMASLVVINTIVTVMVLFAIQDFLDVDINYRPDIMAITGMVIFLIVYLAYFSIWAYNGRGTIGKQIVRIKVVNVEGDTLTFHKDLARIVVKFIFVFAFPGYFLMFFNPQKQALHDYLLGTVVVRKNSKPLNDRA